MSDIDWSKAPEGATHWEPANGHIIASWMKLEGDTWFFWPPELDKPEWKRACMLTDGRVDRMIPRPTTWDGHGMPPVGTVCEVVNVEGNTFTKQFRGKRVRIIAHTRHDDTQLAVFRVESGSIKEWDARYHALVAMCFRPLRTPEQIAAEEREKAIREMVNVMDGIGDDRDCARRLYDAGYRKVEVKP